MNKYIFIHEQIYIYTWTNIYIYILSQEYAHIYTWTHIGACRHTYKHRNAYRFVASSRKTLFLNTHRHNQLMCKCLEACIFSKVQTLSFILCLYTYINTYIYIYITNLAAAWASRANESKQMLRTLLGILILQYVRCSNILHVPVCVCARVWSCVCICVPVWILSLVYVCVVPISMLVLSCVLSIEFVFFCASGPATSFSFVCVFASTGMCVRCIVYKCVRACMYSYPSVSESLPNFHVSACMGISGHICVRVWLCFFFFHSWCV
jgi:hypothetical protein